jgi:hypothetical protein
LGEDFIKVKNSMDDSEIWRYDIGATEGYTSPVDEYDTVDHQGLKNGKLNIQLFIQWNKNGTVEWYSTYQLNKASGQVYEYHVSEDGERIRK